MLEADFQFSKCQILCLDVFFDQRSRRKQLLDNSNEEEDSDSHDADDSTPANAKSNINKTVRPATADAKLISTAPKTNHRMQLLRKMRRANHKPARQWTAKKKKTSSSSSSSSSFKKRQLQKRKPRTVARSRVNRRSQSSTRSSRLKTKKLAHRFKALQQAMPTLDSAQAALDSAVKDRDEEDDVAISAPTWESDSATSTTTNSSTSATSSNNSPMAEVPSATSPIRMHSQKQNLRFRHQGLTLSLRPTTAPTPSHRARARARTPQHVPFERYTKLEKQILTHLAKYYDTVHMTYQFACVWLSDAKDEPYV